VSVVEAPGEVPLSDETGIETGWVEVCVLVVDVVCVEVVEDVVPVPSKVLLTLPTNPPIVSTILRPPVVFLTKIKTGIIIFRHPTSLGYILQMLK